MADRVSKLPDAILTASCMKEIRALQEIQNSRFLTQLDGDLLPIVKDSRATLARLDDKSRAHIRGLLNLLGDAASGIETARRGLPEIGGPLYNRLLPAFFGTKVFEKTSPKELHKNLDARLKKISDDLCGILTALSVVTRVKFHESPKRPRSPYVSAAIRLAMVWEKHAGKLPVKKPVTIRVKDKKSARNNVTPSARFMFYALRMIDPKVKSSEARTATRYAVDEIKRAVKSPPPLKARSVYSSALEGALKMRDGMPLLRENIRRTVTRKKRV
jgi:hypothetical protein